MKSSRLALLVGSLGALLVAGAAWRQSRQIETLRSTLAARATPPTAAASEAKTRPTPPTAPEAGPEAAGTSGAPLTEAQKLELLRLRAEVARLRTRLRELEPARAENVALKKHAATPSASSNSYIPRKQAKFAGQATPEQALESFLWSIEHRDTDRLLSLLADSSATQLREMLQGARGDQFWQEMQKLPGLRVIQSEPTGDTGAVLHVEMIPGVPPQQMNAYRVGTDWKLKL